MPSTVRLASGLGWLLGKAMLFPVLESAQRPVMLICPAAPLVPLTSERRDPEESVITSAVTPMSAELIALATLASVSFCSRCHVELVLPLQSSDCRRAYRSHSQSYP